jgi:hypothetical protein
MSYTYTYVYYKTIYIYTRNYIYLIYLVYTTGTQMHRLHIPNSGRAPTTAVVVVIRDVFLYFPFS